MIKMRSAWVFCFLCCILTWSSVASRSRASKRNPSSLAAMPWEETIEGNEAEEVTDGELSFEDNRETLLGPKRQSTEEGTNDEEENTVEEVNAEDDGDNDKGKRAPPNPGKRAPPNPGKRAPDPKRNPICRTKPRLCEKIKNKVCTADCLTQEKPSCCAHHVSKDETGVTLGGRGLCLTQGYIKRNFKLTLAAATPEGKNDAEGKTYLFMCPKGTDLLATSKRASPPIDKNWPKMIVKMQSGEVGYWGVRSSSWVKSSRRSPAVAQLQAYALSLLRQAHGEEISEATEDDGEDKMADYLMDL